MRHSLPLTPQFYVTAPQPCPYLAGRMERKLFTALHGDAASALNSELSKQGFRRSQNVLYRPSCAECSACYSARLRATDVVPTRSQRRAFRRNGDLTRRVNSAWATEDQYDLFRKYLEHRHATGGMADMDVFEYAAMVEETPVRTRVIEYYDRSQTLVGVALTDILNDGLSMVYSFFDPEREKNSMGSFMIMDHVQIAQASNLPYVYLGYWVPGSEKMAYKARFSPLEVYAKGEWVLMEDPSAFSADPHPISNEPIARQVAQISLPNIRD
jgi:arginyl-tRNA--protein-N-Asp/Glu arginylyltransferase